MDFIFQASHCSHFTIVKINSVLVLINGVDSSDFFFFFLTEVSPHCVVPVSLENCMPAKSPHPSKGQQPYLVTPARSLAVTTGASLRGPPRPVHLLS